MSNFFPMPTFRSILALILATLASVLVALALPAAGQAGGGITSTGGGGTDTQSAGGGSASSESKYSRIWEQSVSGRDKRWAHETAMCESGKDPNAVALGGKYRGAFMFLRSSWKNSPKSPGGDPIDYSYRTQAVIAVLLKKQMGTSPWPVCG